MGIGPGRSSIGFGAFAAVASVKAAAAAQVASSGANSLANIAKGSEGKARPASLKLREGFGTCARHEAAIIVVTEEGTGSCCYYPYATEAAANSYFDARS